MRVSIYKAFFNGLRRNALDCFIYNFYNFYWLERPCGIVSAQPFFIIDLFVPFYLKISFNMRKQLLDRNSQKTCHACVQDRDSLILNKQLYFLCRMDSGVVQHDKFFASPVSVIFIQLINKLF